MDFDLLGRNFDCLEKTCLGKTKDGPDPQEKAALPEDGRRLPDALPEVKQAGWLRRGAPGPADVVRRGMAAWDRTARRRIVVMFRVEHIVMTGMS
jgi:hypothetical protein